MTRAPELPGPDPDDRAPPPGQPADPVAGWLSTAAGVLLAVIVLALAANIGGRTLFGLSLVAAPAFASWSFLAMATLGMPLAVRLARARGERAGRGLAVVTAFLAEAIVAFVAAALAVAAARAVAGVGGVDPVLGLPAGTRFLPMVPSAVLALGLLVLQGGLGRTFPAHRGRAGLAALAGAAGAIGLSFAGQGALPPLDPLSPAAVMGAAFLAGLVLGVPIPFALVFAVLASVGAGATLPLAAVAQTMANAAASPLVLAVPLFMAAAALLVAAGIAARMAALAARLAGRGKGALARVNVVASLMMSGLTGSSYADAAANARLLVPVMRARGYAPGYGVAVTAAAAVMPNLVPPSVALLLLAAAADLSVGALWLAGIGPGLVVAAVLIAAVSVLAPRAGCHGTGGGDGEGLDAAGPGGLARDVAVTLAFVAGLVFGVRFGVLTVTEAGIAAIALAVVLGPTVYGTLGPVAFGRAVATAAGEAARVGFLIAAAAPFSFVLITEGVPQRALALAAAIGEPLLLLLLLNLVLLVFGMVLDIGAGLLVLGPLAVALAVPLGMDPVHLGVMVALNLLIGGLTPPVGLIALVAAEAAGVPARAVFRALMPLIAALLFALALVALVPAIALAPLDALGR